MLQPLLRSIYERFEKVASGLSEQIPASREITQMLASGSTPLPTALIFLLSSRRLLDFLLLYQANIAL